MESTLSYPYSRFHPLLSPKCHCRSPLLSSTLRSGIMALFLFVLAVAYLPTAHFVALRPLFFLVGPVCSRFPAKAYSILQAPCWLRQPQQVCPFSSLLLLCLSFYLKLSGKSFRVFPCPYLYYQVAMTWDTHFFRGTMRLMSWPDGERYLCPLQFLLPLVSTFLELEAHCPTQIP